MARKPKVPEQDSTPAVPDADILPEGQQPEQLEAPNIETVTQPPEVDTEEVGNPTPEILEEAQTPEPISFEAFTAAQFGAAPHDRLFTGQGGGLCKTLDVQVHADSG